MCNWGKFLTKRYEEKKILFMKSQGQNKNWVLEAKAGCCTWPPALNTIKEWACDTILVNVIQRKVGGRASRKLVFVLRKETQEG